jgi:hypothetical protein
MVKRAAAIGLAVAALAAVAFTQLRGGASDPPLDAVAEPGHFRSPPFAVTVSGPLWQARSLRDSDGTEDFALVDGDLRLNVGVRASGGARVAAVELQLDGRRERAVRTACPEAGCPAAANVEFVPRLRGLPAGRHRVEIYARAAPAQREQRTAAFEVRTIGRAPAAVEGEPARMDAPADPHDSDLRLRQTALGVLAAERTRPGLASALGNARLNVIQVGPLNAHGRRLGATLWLALASPLRDVRATVPGYLPSAAAGAGGYTRQSVSLHVGLLRDALVDIDLTTRRVIAFEPGPRSHTLSWKPSRAPAPAGAQDED